MIKKLILYSVLLLPWGSIFKLDRQVFKRYLPVGTFTALIYTTLSTVNQNVKWWKVKTKIFPSLPTNSPFAFGPFIFLPIWIFKYTFGRFWLYSLINAGMGLLFAYPITSLFGKLKIYHLNKMTRPQLFLLSFSSSVVIYFYQYFIDPVLKKESK